MATVASCPSPLLLGLGAQDALLFSTTIAEYRALAGPEMLHLGSLDQVLADAETAAAWLEGYAAELVGGEQNLLAAGAEARGDRPLETLTAAEMARRVAADVERGDADLRESLYTPAPDEAAAGGAPTIAQIARFARQPLSTKVAAVARGTERGLTPSEIVAASTTAGD